MSQRQDERRKTKEKALYDQRESRFPATTG